jgi:hypothetical protein
MERNRSAVIWGALLILLGLVLLLETLGVVRFMGRFVWSVLFVVGGLPFLFVYANNRSQWWALIPGFTLAGIGLGILVGGDLTPIIILGSISLPFWIIYLTDRQQWWALIPGWVLACVATIVVLGEIGLGWFVAPFVMFAIAAPFFLVYLSDNAQWWALIPAGIMGAIGVLLMAGQVMSTGVFWAIVLIVAGLFFIYRALRGGPALSRDSSPGIEEPEPPAPPQRPEEPR